MLQNPKKNSPACNLFDSSDHHWLDIDFFTESRYKDQIEFKFDEIISINISCNICFFFLSDVIFSAFCGVISTLSYFALFVFVLRKMPKSFSYGEASVAVQGFVIFLANLYFKLIILLAIPTDCMKNGNEICSIESHKSSLLQHSTHLSEMEQLTTIIQVIMTVSIYTEI